MTKPDRYPTRSSNGTAASGVPAAADFCSLRSALSFCDVAFTQVPLFAPATRLLGTGGNRVFSRWISCVDVEV